MKATSASFLAMVAGWAVPLVGLAVWQIAGRGTTSDIGVTGLYVGIFALFAWALVVLPLMLRHGEKRIFSDLRCSWLGWGLLAVAIYSVLLPVLYGRAMFEIIWYPAVMGCIAGIVFAVLKRRRGKK